MSRALEDRTKKILILDDDLTFSESIESFLKQKNITCLCANTPKLALQIIENEWVDAVSTDYDMPGMNGEQFSKILSQKEPEIPIIMLTGALEQEQKHRLENTLFAVLSKPVKLGEVFLPICEKAIDIGYSTRRKRLLHTLIDQLNQEKALYLSVMPNEKNENIPYFQQLHYSEPSEALSEQTFVLANFELAAASEVNSFLEQTHESEHFPSTVIVAGSRIISEIASYLCKPNVKILDAESDCQEILATLLALGSDAPSQEPINESQRTVIESMDSFDREYLEDLRELGKIDGNSGFFHNQVTSFLERSSEYQDLLLKSIDNQLPEDIQHCAHRLVSICGFVGAKKASKIAQIIERDYTTLTYEELKYYLDTLKTEIHSAQKLLQTKTAK